jgi:hypothetical protein
LPDCGTTCGVTGVTLYDFEVDLNVVCGVTGDTWNDGELTLGELM